jgi:hypothetical protein
MRQVKASISDRDLQLLERQERDEAIRSIRKGVNDANAGRMRNVGEFDLAIREKLGFPPPNR